MESASPMETHNADTTIQHGPFRAPERKFITKGALKGTRKQGMEVSCARVQSREEARVRAEAKVRRVKARDLAHNHATSSTRRGVDAEVVCHAPTFPVEIRIS